MVRRWSLVVGILLLTVMSVSAAVAQDDAVLELSVRIGFDGYVQTDAWVPITITASNDGDDVSGDLQINVDPFGGERVRFTRPLDLPRGSRKQVTIYINNLSTFDDELQIDLVEDGRVVTSLREEMAFVSDRDLLIGVWSDTPQSFASLGDVEPSQGRTFIALLTAEDIPDAAAGMQALDILAIADADTGQLTPQQRLALQGWVMAGGRLIVAAGPSYQRTLAGLDDLLPVTVTGTESVSVISLFDAVQSEEEVEDASTIVATANADKEAWVWATTEDDVPLIVRRETGLGETIFVAANPGLEPLRSWDEIATLWRLILLEGPQRPGWAFGFGPNWEPAQQASASIPGVRLPSVIQLCGFLGLYVILVGPVNYFILNRLKRRELAWATIPVLVLVFSAIAYVTGFQLRGTQPILHRVSVVQMTASESVARVDSLVGLWSPRRTRYDVELQEGLLARPLPQDGSGFSAVGEATVEQDAVTRLRDIRVDVGAVDLFIVDGSIDTAPDISSSVTLEVDEGLATLEGDVFNNSDVDLVDLTLFVNGRMIVMPDLPRGRIFRIDVPGVPGSYARYPSTAALDPHPQFDDGFGFGYYSSTYYPPLVTDIARVDDCTDDVATRRRCALTQSILASEWHDQGVYLMGWAETSPVDIDLLNANAETNDLTLFIIEIEVPVFTTDS